MRNRTVALVFVLSLLPLPLLGQRTSASVRGTVTDPSGAVVEGAQVTLINSDTGLTRSSTSNSAGNYSFGDVPIGSYVVSAEHAGFSTSVVSNLQLNVADTREVNFALAVGEVSDQVTVEASSVQVETIGGEVAGLITGEQVRELPLNGRNFVQLLSKAHNALVQGGRGARGGQHRFQGGKFTR